MFFADALLEIRLFALFNSRFPNSKRRDPSTLIKDNFDKLLPCQADYLISTSPQWRQNVLCRLSSDQKAWGEPRPLNLVDGFQGRSNGATILEASPQILLLSFYRCLLSRGQCFPVGDYMITGASDLIRLLVSSNSCPGARFNREILHQ